MSESEVPYGSRRRKPKPAPLTAEESDIFGPEPVAPRIDPTDGSHVDCDCVVCEKDAADADRVLAQIVAEAPVPVSAVGQIAEQVRRVHTLRLLEARAGDILSEARHVFEAEHGGEMAEIKELAERVATAEAALKALTLAHHAATGETKPTAGVEVKMFATFDYDPAVAFAWAKEKQMCLVPEQLNTDEFKKIAKATALSFVTKGEKPKVQISTNLDKVLGGVA